MRIVSAVMSAPLGHQVRIAEPERTTEQNAAMWALLTEFSQQLLWPVNGQMVQLSPEDWKDVLSAAFQREARIAEGLDGGHVFLGLRTSQMSKKRFSEFLEFARAVAAERGVELWESA